MREIKILGCLVVAACAGSRASVDSAAARDSLVVSGPPAAPSSVTPSSDSGRSASPSAPVRQNTAPAQTGGATPAKPTPPAAATTTDSVRGIVSVVGTSFEKRVMIAVTGTGRRVEITGPLAGLVGHVAGADVSVAGKSDGARLEASGFTVKAVDGQPAIDGTLKTEGSTLYIVTAGGARTRIAVPPPPLQGRDGSRVWITGDPSRAVSSFGFIDPPR